MVGSSSLILCSAGPYSLRRAPVAPPPFRGRVLWCNNRHGESPGASPTLRISRTSAASCDVLPLLAAEDLARVHDAVRACDPFYLTHERQGVAVFFLQVCGLSSADTMLAGAGAAALQRVVHDLGVNPFGPLLVCLVGHVYGEDGV